MNIFDTTFDYATRLKKIRTLMDEREIDALLVHLWPNQYYISGMYQHLPWYPVENVVHTETPLVVFRDFAKDPVFLITWLTGNALREGTWIKDVRIIDKEPFGVHSWEVYLAEVLEEAEVESGTIGIEEKICTLSTFKKLKTALPRAQFVGVDEIFEIARLKKEPEEVELIRKSVLIAEAGLKAGIEAAKVGVTETEIQKAAEIEMKRLGALREIETMCQSGIRTANHRAFAASWKEIKENELVMIDIGCNYKGYGSDLTRTWVVGTPTEKHAKITEDLVGTRETILSAMAPGVSLGEIKEMGREELVKAGYITNNPAMPTNGKGWASVTIHGIGLGPMHDPPHVDDTETRLEAGMTLAVAAGVRHRDFTIRFEDNIVITEKGYELINNLIPWEL